MKTTKIIYWVSSAIIAMMMTFSAYAYITVPAIAENFRHIGFPDYFRIELAIAKIIGAAFILLPVGPRIKEWVYAGFTITFISAFIAHTVGADPFANKITPVVFLLLLIASYLSYHKVQAGKKIALLQPEN